MLAVSTDALATHERWLVTPPSSKGLGGLNYPLASDEDGSVCRAYGVYVPRQHVAQRGLFLIDTNGVLQYQVVHNLSVGRSTDEMLRVLDALQSGGLCPGDWTPTQATLDAGGTLGPNSEVGHFRLEAILGSGAFGTVFRARDLTLDRIVALKVLQSDSPRAAELLLAEARVAAALLHPNVCVLHAVDQSLGFPMIVMEYIEGETLAKVIENRRLSVQDASAIARQIAQGMAAAHAKDIVHGDLKPANIMISSDGVAKIMDFGLARRYASSIVPVVDTVDGEANRPGGLFGTPAYMSPEQARGQSASPASDVFALGLILYEMVTGRRAVRGEHLLEVLRQVENVDAEKLTAEMTDPFRAVLKNALAQDPERRSLAMAEIAEALGPTSQ